jgi:hypothetical protein
VRVRCSADTRITFQRYECVWQRSPQAPCVRIRCGNGLIRRRRPESASRLFVQSACPSGISHRRVKRCVRGPSTKTRQRCFAMNSCRREHCHPVTCSGSTSGSRYWTSKATASTADKRKVHRGVQNRSRYLGHLHRGHRCKIIFAEDLRLLLCGDFPSASDGKRGPKSVSWSKCPAWTAPEIPLCKLPMRAT